MVQAQAAGGAEGVEVDFGKEHMSHFGSQLRYPSQVDPATADLH